MEGLCSGVNSNSISSIIYLYQIQWMGYTGCCTGRDPTKIPTRDTVLLHAVSEANSRGGKNQRVDFSEAQRTTLPEGAPFIVFPLSTSGDAWPQFILKVDGSHLNVNLYFCFFWSSGQTNIMSVPLYLLHVCVPRRRGVQLVHGSVRDQYKNSKRAWPLL